MRKIGLLFTGLIVGLIAFVSCNQNEAIDLKENEGRLNVLVTDAPFPVDLIDNAIVTINKVEIKTTVNVDSSGLETRDSFIVVSENQMDLDLLQLTNGITEQIGSIGLEAGYYDEIRLHITDANVVLKNGEEYDLKVPSGSSSGLKVKIDPAINIEAGQTSDLLLDFDVSKSFVLKGNLKNIVGFNFKPVVRGVNMGFAGKIEGVVTDTTGSPQENVMVKVWNASEMEEEGGNEENEILGMVLSEDEEDYVVSAFTDEEGYYQIIGLEEGEYVLTFEREGFATFTSDEVEIEASSTSLLDVELDNE